MLLSQYLTNHRGHERKKARKAASRTSQDAAGSSTATPGPDPDNDDEDEDDDESGSGSDVSLSDINDD